MQANLKTATSFNRQPLATPFLPAIGMASKSHKSAQTIRDESACVAPERVQRRVVERFVHVGAPDADQAAAGHERGMQ